MIKEDYKDYISRLAGIDHAAFLAAMALPAETSIKLNRRKNPRGGEDSAIGRHLEEMPGVEAEPVKWCGSGFYLTSRPEFTLNPLLHGGAFYVQDASSMIYEWIMERILSFGTLPASPAVLDLCAAPGGKTTSLINALPDGSLVVANEYVPKRAKTLCENLLKWGYPDIIVTQGATQAYARAGARFDVVAVDAPCSGEGMMRKDATACTQWSERLIEQCAATQREILADAIEALRPGGYLIYSTCTFNTRENENNLRMLVEEHGLEPIDTNPPESWGIGREIAGEYPALRFMPHLTRGEGLFAALLRKPSSSDDDAPAPKKWLDTLSKNTRILLNGVPRTEKKGSREIPTTEYALSVAFDPTDCPTQEIGREAALNYLRHQAITLPEEAPRGPVAVAYRGIRLGIVNNLGTRANNLYPSEWKIKFK